MRMEVTETRKSRRPSSTRKTSSKARAKTSSRKFAAAKTAKSKTIKAKAKTKSASSRSSASMRVAKLKGRNKAKTKTSARRTSSGSSASAKSTINHNEIQRWAEARDGAPATVKGTHKGSAAGLLRIDFPGFSGENTLEHISWDEWFEKFDEKKLAFLYQNKAKGGKESRFFKLIKRK